VETGCQDLGKCLERTSIRHSQVEGRGNKEVGAYV